MFRNKKGIGTDDYIPLIFTVFVLILFLLFYGVGEGAQEGRKNDIVEQSLFEVQNIGVLYDFLDTRINDKSATEQIYRIGLEDNNCRFRDRNVNTKTCLSFLESSDKYMKENYDITSGNLNWKMTIKFFDSSNDLQKEVSTHVNFNHGRHVYIENTLLPVPKGYKIGTENIEKIEVELRHSIT